MRIVENKGRDFMLHALILSIALNIGLVSTFICLRYFKGAPAQSEKIVTYAEGKTSPIVSANSQHVLSHLLDRSFEGLLLDLKRTELIEDGFRYRDLALGVLLTFHHFDIDHALPGAARNSRTIRYLVPGQREPSELKLISGQGDEAFLAIQKFARSNEWPFTSKGLFQEIKHWKGELPASLREAVFSTPEFSRIWTLFRRTDLQISRDYILEMLSDCDLASIENLANEEDLGLDSRRRFLRSVLLCRSTHAAELLLSLESKWAIKRLSDEEILLLLDLISKENADFKEAMLSLLTSPRSDKVHEKAGKNSLYFTWNAHPGALSTCFGAAKIHWGFAKNHRSKARNSPRTHRTGRGYAVGHRSQAPRQSHSAEKGKPALRQGLSQARPKTHHPLGGISSIPPLCQG